MKRIRPIAKTKIPVYQSKANLDVKILFGYIIRLIDPELRIMLDRKEVCMGTKIPHFILVHVLPSIEIEIHF